jgi:hypothetical protein
LTGPTAAGRLAGVMPPLMLVRDRALDYGLVVTSGCPWARPSRQAR